MLKLFSHIDIKPLPPGCVIFYVKYTNPACVIDGPIHSKLKETQNAV